MRTHGTPQQIVRDPIAIREYLGTSMDDTPGSAAANAGARGRCRASVQQVLEHERVYRTIELLRDNATAPAAVAELVRRGRSRRARPARRPGTPRRRTPPPGVHGPAAHLRADGAAFDPFAPEAQRRQQIAVLRQHSSSACRKPADISAKSR